MENLEKKQKSGIILLSMAGIFLILSLILINRLGFNLIFSLLSLILGITGAILYHKGSDIREQGILLLVIGAILIGLSVTFLFNLINQFDALIIFIIVDVIFFLLCFFVPGGLMVIKKIKFKEEIKNIYSIDPIFVFGMYIYNIVTFVMYFNTFLISYLHNFMIAIIASFMGSVIIVFLSRIFT
ncbi:MAG: hypothetical protein EU550_03695 [Promethearchaeota archaeon]|nr:MAG: hypothetical protein EU550_03695 [Candidatus Lokiarchaeota archaeon]